MSVSRNIAERGFGHRQTLSRLGAARLRVLLIRTAILAMTALTGQAYAGQNGPIATYEVRVLGTGIPRIAVRATVPSDGAELSMATSRRRQGVLPDLAPRSASNNRNRS